MKNRFVAMAMAGICSLAAGTCWPAVANAQPADTHAFLARLSFPENALRGCVPTLIPADAGLPAGLKNRTVTTEPAAFLVGDERLQDMIDPATIQAFYWALYSKRDSNRDAETGINAWQFGNEETAAATYRMLTDSYADETERTRFWLAGSHVVWLWRDPGAEDCFDQLARLIDGSVQT